MGHILWGGKQHVLLCKEKVTSRWHSNEEVGRTKLGGATAASSARFDPASESPCGDAQGNLGRA